MVNRSGHFLLPKMVSTGPSQKDKKAAAKKGNQGQNTLEVVTKWVLLTEKPRRRIVLKKKNQLE